LFTAKTRLAAQQLPGIDITYGNKLCEQAFAICRRPVLKGGTKDARNPGTMLDTTLFHKLGDRWMATFLRQTTQYLITLRFVMIQQIGNDGIKIGHRYICSPCYFCIDYLPCDIRNQCLFGSEVAKNGLDGNVRALCDLLKRNLVDPRLSVERNRSLNNPLAREGAHFGLDVPVVAALCPI
jgi:hypothetical protein